MRAASFDCARQASLPVDSTCTGQVPDGLALVPATSGEAAVSPVPQPAYQMIVGEGCDVPKTPKCTDINHVSYHFVFQKMTWEEGNKYCRDNYEHGSLATIHSQEEMEKFNEVMKYKTSYPVWLGGRRAVDDSGKFFWIWNDEDTPDTSGSEICQKHPMWDPFGAYPTYDLRRECIYYEREMTFADYSYRGMRDMFCGDGYAYYVVCSSRC